MPDFAYIARDKDGTKVTGSISAATQRDVLAQLAAQSLFPVTVTSGKAAQPIFGGKRVGGNVMATVYSQMAGLLRSGVPLLRSIAVLRDQSSHARLKEVLTDVHARVEEGTSMGDAMARYPRVFSEMAINMVRAGAEGGFLEDALERVAQFTEQQEDLKGRTVGALAYPMFLAGVGTLVVMVLLVFFVPKFAPMFDTMRAKGELPPLTDWLLWFSGTLRSWGWIGVVFAVIGGMALNAQLDNEDGRRRKDMLKLRIPLLGPIFKNLAVARFCRVLGTLLKNGVPILKSLEISRDAAGNRVLSDAIARASENISSGQKLASPLASCGHFPRNVVEMIAVAEESNTLDRVLVEVADGLEKQTGRRLDLAVRLLEPIMLLLLAIVVLLVVIALLMPVIKMSSTI